MDIRTVANKLRSTVVDHPYYELSYNRLYNLSAIAQPGSVIMVVGPTHVGKTMLSRKLLATLVWSDSEKMSQDTSIVRIEAATTDQGFISTRYLMLCLLAALDHPFYVGDRNIRLSDSESMLRKRLVNAIKARKTQYIIIDEAHHLLRTKSDRRAEGALDSIKCLGNETNCVLIFVGGYELLAYLFLSAHLNGRMTVIDFPNYGLDEQGIIEFDRLLVTVDQWLPWARGMSLYKFRDHIYEGTQGCYGQLIHWSISAIAEMKSQGNHHLKLAHFLSTRRAGQVQAIKDDIAKGRLYLADLTKQAREIGVESPPDLSKSRSGRPFQRKPIRDRVGIDN